MLKFRAKSNIVLGLIALLSILSFIAVEKSRTNVKKEWYSEKLKAAELSKQAALCLKEFRLEEGIFIDEVNDPNQSALIGQEYTNITTDEGKIDDKLSTLNPNFAAVIVQYLKDIGLKKNDCVAISFTGSFPALNISVISAIEVLGLKPIIITAVGSSNYGANDPNFTWLDMENVLFSSGIFHCKSVAASLSGGFDNGRGLSVEGRQLIVDAINRNKVMLIKEDFLEKSIEKRMQIYEQESKSSPIKAYINVDKGIASLGHTVNASLIPTGLVQKFPEINFPVRGVIVQMGQKNIPVIQLVNIDKILKQYNLPYSPIPIPEPGSGGIFFVEKYNIWVALIAIICLMVFIIIIYLSERKVHKLGSELVPLPSKSDNNSNNSNDSFELL